ncbi:MAG: hypothetical protein ACLQGV_16245 [Bryobacteraceae bacterium]
MGGFETLTGGEPAEVAVYLEHLAVSTGTAAPLFLSQAVRAVDSFMREHDECGGVRASFIQYIDKLVRDCLMKVHSETGAVAAEIARDFRDEVCALLGQYDSGKPNGL